MRLLLALLLCGCSVKVAPLHKEAVVHYRTKYVSKPPEPTPTPHPDISPAIHDQYRSIYEKLE